MQKYVSIWNKYPQISIIHLKWASRETSYNNLYHQKSNRRNVTKSNSFPFRDG